MTRPRIVAHIGAAKTATTSIQHALYDHAEALQRHGIYLPTAGRFQFTKRTVAHHHLAWQLVDTDRHSADAGGWEALRDEIADVDAEVVLVSSESLERLTYNADRRARLAHELAKLSDRVTILYVVRDQLSQLNSLYNQGVKSFRTVETFEQFVQRVVRTGHLNLERRFVPWLEDDAVDFVAVPFPQLVAGDPLRNLLGAAQIELPADILGSPRPASNESLGPMGVEAARLLGTQLRVVDPAFSYTSPETLKLYRVSAARARANGWCEEKHWGWAPDVADRMIDKWADSNARFAKAAWGDAAALTFPTGNEQRALRLVDQSRESIAAVQRYVAAMTQRYLKIRQSQRGSGSKGAAAAGSGR